MSKTYWEHFSIRRIVFWGIGLALAVGLFFFARAFTICWRLTSLEGLPSAGCAGKPVNAIETPVIVNKKATPQPTSTPETQDQDVEYPTWDGSSRINIL